MIIEVGYKSIIIFLKLCGFSFWGLRSDDFCVLHFTLFVTNFYSHSCHEINFRSGFIIYGFDFYGFFIYRLSLSFIVVIWFFLVFRSYGVIMLFLSLWGICWTVDFFFRSNAVGWYWFCFLVLHRCQLLLLLRFLLLGMLKFFNHSWSL